jgi:glutamate-1-semialdehyde 2,1-aminomutase
MSFGTTTREEISLAELIVDAVPSIDKIRFVNSGTEATMSAIRVARGYTKRDMIVKFDGCYHGHFDDLLAKAGSGVAQLSESSSLGIPQKHIQNTISLPYNDEEILEKTLTQHKDKVACVIVEPVAGNMGVIPANPSFLKKLRELTLKFGIVLIFDEVMTGFRTSRGCAQSDYGVIPDMTCLGKIIGSGFPVGAYGGRKDIMDCLAPVGGVYQAGTFAGNPVVMHAGYASLKLLGDGFYARLNKKCENFAVELNRFFAENNIDAHLSAYKSMMSIRFRKEPVLNYEDAQNAGGGKKYFELFKFLLDKGIYFPPADLEAYFIGACHTAKDLNYLMGCLKEFFTDQ